MIQLFASDLDGTLLNADHQFDATIIEGIRALHEKGKKFAIATGRGRKQCSIEEVDPYVYKICMNGAMILDPDNNILDKTPIPKDLLKEIIDTFPDYPLDFVTPDAILTHYSQEEFLEKRVHQNKNEQWKKRYMRDFFPIVRFNQNKEDILNADVCKINLRINDVDDYSRLDEFIQANPDRLINAPSGYGLYEITAASVNKGYAVAKLAQLCQIPEAQVAVYGDGGNDIEMLKRFENAYAPSNAISAAKEAAKEVIGPNDEYSVIKHMTETN